MLRDSYLVKVTRKGQITIPQPLRAALNIEEGDFLVLRVEEGRIVVEKVGIPEPGEPVGVEEYEEVIAELEEVRGKWR